MCAAAGGSGPLGQIGQQACAGLRDCARRLVPQEAGAQLVERARDRARLVGGSAQRDARTFEDGGQCGDARDVTDLHLFAVFVADKLQREGDPVPIGTLVGGARLSALAAIDEQGCCPEEQRQGQRAAATAREGHTGSLIIPGALRAQTSAESTGRAPQPSATRPESENMRGIKRGQAGGPLRVDEHPAATERPPNLNRRMFQGERARRGDRTSLERARRRPSFWGTLSSHRL
jgi:hypothetical protein